MTRERPAFIITVDTEGDNEWARPNPITTRNAAYLPRFQALCEEFGFKPTWLTNYEMATSEEFVRFGRDAIARGTAEIGMHLHAWSSPPVRTLTHDDHKTHPYLIEFPDEVMAEKVRFLTQLLEQTFQTKMISHRAGRWAFDARYAQILLDNGYRVDCSVTPHVSWRDHLGDPNGRGGSDYTDFPEMAYMLDLQDIRRSGRSGLLEVPPTIMRSKVDRLAPWIYTMRRARGAVAKVLPPRVTWLRPTGENLAQMLGCVRAAIAQGRSYVQFMIHSSELMPGGSPLFATPASIEHLYADLRALFVEIARHARGMTLQEFHAAQVAEPSPAHAVAA